MSADPEAVTIEAAAQNLVDAMGKVRRRARPRMAPSLMEADHAMIPTALGAVATWRLGAGSAVLLVHGWEDDNSLWDPLIERLVESRLPLVALDLPAHGYSEGEELDLIGGGGALADVWRAARPFWAVVTHSFGGPLLVEAIEHHGLAPQRAVLIAPPLRQIDQFRRIGARHGVAPAAVERAIAMTDARTGRAMVQNDLARAAPAMPCPALFVHSADDEDCPVEAAHVLAAHWPGGAKLILDGFGHRLIARDAGVCDRIAAYLMEG
jgi:pimeloyl-ACP methyl ester carboxylesterase